MLQSERSDMRSLPRRVRGQRDAGTRVPAIVRLTSGLERRGSGGLGRRALVRAQRRGIASRRRRRLSTAVGHARCGCHQLRRRGIEVLRLGCRRQQLTMVRRGDTRARAVMPVYRDARAPERVAPENQQERRGKEANQGTRSGRRHVTGCALTSYANVRRWATPSKRQLTAFWCLDGGSGLAGS